MLGQKSGAVMSGDANQFGFDSKSFGQRVDDIDILVLRFQIGAGGVE